MLAKVEVVSDKRVDDSVATAASTKVGAGSVQVLASTPLARLCLWSKRGRGEAVGNEACADTGAPESESTGLVLVRVLVKDRGADGAKTTLTRDAEVPEQAPDETAAMAAEAMDAVDPMEAVSMDMMVSGGSFKPPALDKVAEMNMVATAGVRG